MGLLEFVYVLGLRLGCAGASELTIFGGFGAVPAFVACGWCSCGL